MPLQIVLIDNVDSFTFNLVDEFKRRDCDVDVWRNHADPREIASVINRIRAPKLLVLSPGPGHPRQAGCCLDLMPLVNHDVPILGVCLGHQVIVEAFGGSVGAAGEIVHGKTSPVTHDGCGIFAELPNPLLVGRYHSLAAVSLPDALTPTAHLGDIVMAVHHKTRPVQGVQFHPESILTPRGGLLIENLLEQVVSNQEFR